MHHIKFNQTWEDFDVDKRILDLKRDDTLVCVTSAGCNVLNASLQGPKKIYSIDANPDQNHLLQLKIAATTLPFSDFWQLFGEGRHQNVLAIYDAHLRKNLPNNSQAFWDKNIYIFKNNLFGEGKLSSLRYLRACIKILCGEENLIKFFTFHDLGDQAKFYTQTLEPKLWNWCTKYIPTFTMLFYGAHLRQIWNCYKRGLWYLKDLYQAPQKFAFENIPMRQNYFWHYIFLGYYQTPENCPEYLRESNYSQLAKNASTIEIQDTDMVQFLCSLDESSIDKFSLSDIVEFGNPAYQNELWEAVLRAAKPGAIISYRSFAPEVFPPEFFQNNFILSKSISEELTKIEKSISYLGVYKFTVNK